MHVPFDIIKKAIKEKTLVSGITRYHRNGDWAVCHKKTTKPMEKTYTLYTVLMSVTNDCGGSEDERLYTEQNGREFNPTSIQQIEPLSDEYYTKLKKHYNL